MVTKKYSKKWDIVSGNKHCSSLDEIVSTLIQNRGIKDADRDEFLHPKLENITSRSVDISQRDLKKMLIRLEKALQEKEMIIIYGDYDVDGITGTAIFWEVLITLGFTVMPYIPHRLDEGYGLSEKGIDNLLNKYPETKLIITVDNGIVANGAVDYAKSKGLEVIITDHHLSDVNDKKPAALAIVHTVKLCGAGLVWLIAQDIKDKFSQVSGIGEDVHLELAALGTVADLVPLTDANRAIVHHGLKKLSQTSRRGLQELYTNAAIGRDPLNTYEAGHLIAPRLNAAGRLVSAMDSLRLLCTKDKNRAILLAQKLEGINKDRQRIMQDAVMRASKDVGQRAILKKLLVVVSESYEEGIIGLVAGRIVEEYHRPTIVITKGEIVSKGSVRSISGFNIIEFLRSQKNLFINVGGHPMAAGFTIQTEKINDLREILEGLAENLITDESLQKKLKIDLELPFNDISDELFARIDELAPFGMGNFEPTFLSKQVLVRQKRMLGKEGKHLRLVLQGGELGKVIEAVAFGMGDRVEEIKEEGYVDIVYTVGMNEWNGNRRLQVKIRDFKLSP